MASNTRTSCTSASIAAKPKAIRLNRIKMYRNMTTIAKITAHIADFLISSAIVGVTFCESLISYTGFIFFNPAASFSLTRALA